MKSLRTSYAIALLIAFHASVKAEHHFHEPAQSNVIYGMDHGAALLMDVYQPDEPNGYGIVFTMGTGFTAYGEYDDVPLKELDRWLLERGVFSDYYGEKGQFFGPALDAGFTVFSINHRLGPANHWKTQIRDCQRAVQYVRSRAADFGIDAHWIASMGHSSGAAMATFLGVTDDVALPEAHDPVNRFSSKTQAVIAIAGLHDTLGAIKQRPSSKGMLTSYTGRELSYQPPGHPIYDTYRNASTVSHVSADDAPFFIIHGKSDNAVAHQQSEALISALESAAVPYQAIWLEKANHAELNEELETLPIDAAIDWLQTQLP